MKKIELCFCLIMLLTAFNQESIAHKNDSVEVMKATSKFVESFNSFDWKAFSNSFNSDITIFFPEWSYGKRKAGADEVAKNWLEIFPEFSDSLNTARLTIQPRDIMLQLHDNMAIVTFHIGSGEKDLGRRTIVWVRKKKVWKIAHLHASYLAAR